MKITSQISFTDFSKYPNIRLGSYYKLPRLKYPYQPFENFLSSLEAGSRPNGGIQESDYGQAISLGGEQIGIDGALNVEKLPYIPMDYYDSTTKGKISNNDILLCKDGALTGKVCQVDCSNLPCSQVMANEHVYVVRANKLILQKFLFYLMRTDMFQNQIKDFAYHKKGQPGLNSDHIKALKIPCVPYNTQESFINNDVVKIEQQVFQLLNKTVSDSSIIDEVFSREFGFDYTQFNALARIKKYSTDTCCFANNPDLRFSAKFHREAGAYVMSELKRITSKKIKNFLAEPIVLGASVAPTDYDEDGEYCYISMATIKNWHFDIESASTVADSYSEAKMAKTVSKNDIIMARSGEGTIGKVALIETDSIRGIFADFTMRIRLKNYNPKFAYYYFRTSYYQYLVEIYKKGLGNNTNIFPIVIQEFPMIDISLEEQQRIVDEIQCKMNAQSDLKKKSNELRAKIEALLENVISGETETP